MTQLIVKSDHATPIIPLLRAAIKTELQVINTGIRRTQARLQQFEQHYGFSTTELLNREQAGTLNDDELETIEWLGESRMLLRLQDERRALTEIEICS